MVSALPPIDDVGVTGLVDFLRGVALAVKQKLSLSKKYTRATVHIPWLRSWSPSSLLGTYMLMFRDLCGVRSTLNATNGIWTVDLPSSTAFTTVFQTTSDMLECEIPHKTSAGPTARVGDRKCLVIKLALVNFFYHPLLFFLNFRLILGIPEFNSSSGKR